MFQKLAIDILDLSLFTRSQKVLHVTVRINFQCSQLLIFFGPYVTCPLDTFVADFVPKVLLFYVILVLCTRIKCTFKCMLLHWKKKIISLLK